MKTKQSFNGGEPETARPALRSSDVETIAQRLAILDTLRERLEPLTLGQIDKLEHAGEVIFNPAIFLTIVEPLWRLLRESGGTR